MNGVVLADWLQSLAPLIVVVFWVLRQVLSANQQEPAAPRRPAGDGKSLEEKLLDAMGDQEKKPDAQRARAQGDPEAQQQRAEVEEFLRRIKHQHGGEDESEAPPAQSGPIDPFEEPARRVREPAAARGTREIELLIDDRAEMAAESATPVGGLAEQHLPESQLAEQAAHLGERIAAADAQFESRLHGKFDHSLGKLEERRGADDLPSKSVSRHPAEEGSPEVAPPSAASRVVELLKKPGGFRDAVVLSEILHRPNDPFGPRSSRR